MFHQREAGHLTAECCASVCSAAESVNNVMQHKQGGQKENSVTPEGPTREH